MSVFPSFIDSTKKQQHIWLVSGPAGSGKTSVAKFLSESLKLPYVEGDSFHPPSNVAKMAQGIPLTDEDRWDWLTTLRDESIRELKNGHQGVVVTCSALKRKYRDVLRVAPYYLPGLQVHFIFLTAPKEVLLDRVGARQGHFMHANMVESQLAVLEPATPEETDIITVDVSPSMDKVNATALRDIQKAMATSGTGGPLTNRWKRRVRRISLVSLGAFAIWQGKDICLDVWHSIMSSRGGRIA